MKKLILVAMLGLFGFAASANNKITIVNDMPGCASNITVQFYAYQEGTCIFDIASPVYSVPSTPGPGAVYDLCDPSTWLPLTLWMPSYETFTAIVCITCPGFPPVCLPEIFIDMNPAHACVTTPAAGPVPIKCCPGSLSANVIGGLGGGSCFELHIHP